MTQDGESWEAIASGVDLQDRSRLQADDPNGSDLLCWEPQSVDTVLEDGS